MAAITAQDNRWLRCDLKTTSLLANVLLRQLSVDAGCAETVLLRDGWLTEGSSSSVFLVRDGVILTPPETHLMLPGITYEVVLELARAAGIAVRLSAIDVNQLLEADEVFLTNSIMQVMPVCRLERKAIGDDRPGPLTRQLAEAYDSLVARETRGEWT